MSKHLVIGASGQIGEQLVCALRNAKLEVLGTYNSRPVPDAYFLDIRDVSQTRSLIVELHPDVIYLPAAQTNVDACELNPADTYITNVLGVKNILLAATEVAAKPVYFSTDYIFDGKNGPYSETDPVNPICEYGRQKVYAEHLIAMEDKQHLIVRTTVVYGWERQGKNFIYQLLRSLNSGQIIRVPVDQIGNPTYAPDLAQTVVSMVLSGASGVYNVVGSDRIDRYQFARQAARVFGLNQDLVLGVSTYKLGQQARRPLVAGLRLDKLDDTFGIKLSSCQEGLQKMADERKNHLI